MMAHRILATMALLATLNTAHATRVLEQPERPYELSLSQLTLPSSTNGGVTVKPCEDCTYSTHVLTDTTLFVVNRQSVSFADFRLIAEELRANQSAEQSTFVGLFVDVETGRVTRITLRHRGL
jgi:hypothetical protein